MLRAARDGPASAAASWVRVNRCQPKAAPFISATRRATSLAASRFAPTISTSSVGSRVLWQGPDADLLGCNADDEGENDRGPDGNEHKNLIAQPGTRTSCPIEFRLI